MKKISRILTTVLCCAPFALVHAAPVATTSGSNLTAFNPSNVNNNQWATISNGRYDASNTNSAKANFGNCNSIVLRCAQPKCANGGCTDMAVASAIVNGCVQSNASCKQYGADLVNYMSAQMVALSSAKVNEQQLAAQQAAAAAASAESQQQMQQMQYQMQQMQQQMAKQQQESAQQIQAALAEQQAQSAAALAEMKSAATTAAKETEAGISAYQQEAINRGITEDVLMRQTMAGQVKTDIEDAEASITTMKKVLQNAFKYAKCDNRGNNCEGPKRIKKWRELATDFIDPYNNAIDKMYGALEDSLMLGVDLSQIYMMLDDSCASWGQYMCPQKDDSIIAYGDTTGGKKGSPSVCDKDTYKDCVDDCRYASNDEWKDPDYTAKCIGTCSTTSLCQPCTLLKMLSGEDAIYEGWVNAEGDTSEGNTTVVACTSGVLNSSKLFAGRARKKNGANLVDIDVLDVWLNQTEPNVRVKDSTVPEKSDYCYTNNSTEKELRKSALSKTVNTKKLCVNEIKPNNAGGAGKPEYEDECPYIDPIYAICDVHPYNASYETLDKDFIGGRNCTAYAKEHFTEEEDKIMWAYQETEGDDNTCKVKLCKDKFMPTSDGKGCEDAIPGYDREAAVRTYNDMNSSSVAANETKEIVGLKTTVLSQQMYKQYEYLNATIRRLKIQLEKAIVKTNLEAAGAKDSSSSSLGGLAGRGSSDDKKVVLAGAENCANSNSSSAVYKCLQNNISVIIANASSNRQKACTQLKNNITWAGTWSINLDSGYSDCGTSCGKDRIVECSQALNQKVIQKIEEKESSNRQYSGFYMPSAKQSE